MALFCAAAVCFWLFALAFGTARGAGLHVASTDTDESGVEATALLIEGAEESEAPGETDAAATAAVQLALPCRAAILIEQNSGTVLYEMNADEQMPIASITKVMTLLLTFEAIHDGKLTLQDTVPVSEHAYSMGGSQIWLEPGEQFTLDEMLKAICVASANDAAVAVAELVGGSEPVFVERMNARAAELGMTNTTFRNACGLDTEGHLSTARDVATMSRQILTTCPEILQYTSIWTDTLRDGATQLVNTNKLLRRYNGITGLKTGTTGGAGVCISASATRDGLDLIAVVLGAASSADRFDAATTLLDYGFANYEAAALPTLDPKPLQLAVTGSAAESIPLDYSALPESLLLEKGSRASLTAEVSLPDSLTAPVVYGQQVGSVTVRCGEQVLGEYPVCAAAEAKKLDFSGALELLTDSLRGA
jgi:D-alanyl-D-alanine carboxypeptidase (penicillin-binding protein 5/6)